MIFVFYVWVQVKFVNGDKPEEFEAAIDERTKVRI